ncbi:MAG: hypothetical protein ABR552_10645 [Actinomycetota bacterium]
MGNPAPRLVRRPWRPMLISIAALLFAMIFSPAARADGPVRLDADSSTWFWASNPSATKQCEPPNPDLPPPPTTTQPCGPVSLTQGSYGVIPGESPISKYHMGVSLKDGESDMRSYVHYEFGSLVPYGAHIDRMVMTLSASTIDSEHVQEHQHDQYNAPATINAQQAVVQACALTSGFGNARGGGGDSPFTTTIGTTSNFDPNNPNGSVTTMDVEPVHDCSLKAQGIPTPDLKYYSFDITEIAQKWMDGSLFNSGVAILPVPTAPKQTWTIEFHGAQVVTEDANGNKVSHLGKEFAATSAITFSGGGFTPPPPSGAGGGGGGGGFISQPPPPGGGVPPPPITPTITPSTPQQTLVASQPKTPATVWLIFPLGLLGLALMTNAVGEDPVGATGDKNRVARLLRDRRLNGTSAPDEP